MERAIQLAREALELAEEKVLRHMRSPLKTTKEIEIEVERILREHLTNKMPQYAFLGEEEGLSGPEHALFTWICDPISSTKHLEECKAGFSICLALLEDEEPVFAFVLDPMRKDHYFAKRGMGAFYNGEALVASEEKTLEYGNFSCNYKQFYTTILRLQKEFSLWHKNPESPSLTFCKVARGELLFYFGLPKDNLSIVAGLLIAKEAGCTIRDFYGEVWSAQRTLSLGLVVSHNENVYKGIQEYLRRPL